MNPTCASEPWLAKMLERRSHHLTPPRDASPLHGARGCRQLRFCWLLNAAHPLEDVRLETMSQEPSWAESSGPAVKGAPFPDSQWLLPLAGRQWKRRQQAGKRDGFPSRGL